jgi:PBSX family phage terminase large subunit
MSESLASVKKLTALEREREALALRKSGLTYDLIGQRLGITPQGAHRAVMRALAKLRTQVVEGADQLRTLELQRLDAMFDPMYAQAARGGQGAVDRCIRIMERRARLLGLDLPTETQEDAAPRQVYKLPVDAISDNFYPVYRDIWAGGHSEYILSGGRGSTKSSFASLIVIEQLLNNPQIHGLALRQVQNTLRDSIYNQLVWAIGYLASVYPELEGQFKCTTNPLEITFKPTGQKIYFRGGDDPLKIKSIKPPFGYIGILLFEELDQFRGQAAIRSIVQSAIRGGDRAIQIKVINPPRSRNNWAIQDMAIPNEHRMIHRSTYLQVPPEWLGKAFLDEAEFLKEINPDAYRHEYLGESIGVGGLVFDNVTMRRITDAEIAQFDHVCHGLDFGYYPDPAHYSRCHYDAARLTLYIYGEVRLWKSSNRRIYDSMVSYGLTPSDTLICDSAEPKSIADLREYGAAARGAEKGPDSVRYSIKWMQSLKSIVIDNTRCPHTAEEFLNYEHEQTKDGEYISEYPDKDNHAIDSVRYGTNLIWRRRGQ